MNNIFCTGLQIDYRYDLKGSTCGRILDDQSDPTIALKDLNLLNSKDKFNIGPDNKKKLLNIIHQDMLLLSNCNIIDYSLLVGVHDMEKHKDTI